MIAMMMVGIWSQRDDPEAFLYPELLILDCEKNKQTNKTGYFNFKKKTYKKTYNNGSRNRTTILYRQSPLTHAEDVAQV